MAELNKGFSLADFAGMVTDDIKAVDSLLPVAGTFAVRVNDAALGENEAKEGIDPKTGEPFLPLFFVNFKCEVLEAKPLDVTIDADSLVGKVYTDRYTFWPSNFSDMIALLKGRYRKVGLPIEGAIGGLEGGTPGWLDGAKDKIIGLKIVHRSKLEQTNAYFSWFALDTDEESAGEAEAEKLATA